MGCNTVHLSTNSITKNLVETDWVFPLTANIMTDQHLAEKRSYAVFQFLNLIMIKI
jgi:hypothetical protein